MENTIRDFNGAAKFFLGLSMVGVALTIVSSSISIGNYKYFGWDTSILVKEIVIDLLILGAGVLTFLKKRAGLIGLVVLFIIRVFATIPQGGNVSMAGHLGANSALFFRDFGPFAIAMFFRKNGISGWDAMLSTDNHSANKPSRSSCIEENTRVRNARDILFDGPSAVSKESLSSRDIKPEKKITVSEEEVMKSNESPSISTAPSETPIAAVTPNGRSSMETVETEQSNLAEISEKNRISELEKENTLLKQMYAELALRMSRKNE